MSIYTRCSHPANAGAEPAEEGDANASNVGPSMRSTSAIPYLGNWPAAEAGRAGWGLAVEEANQFAALPVG